MSERDQNDILCPSKDAKTENVVTLMKRTKETIEAGCFYNEKGILFLRIHERGRTNAVALMLWRDRTNVLWNSKEQLTTENVNVVTCTRTLNEMNGEDYLNLTYKVMDRKITKSSLWKVKSMYFKDIHHSASPRWRCHEIRFCGCFKTVISDMKQVGITFFALYLGILTYKSHG